MFSKQIEVYRHRRIVFGVSSRSFLGGIIEKALQRVEVNEKRKVIRHLPKFFYMDNCVSVESKEELFLFKKEAERIMTKGKFDLRGWKYSG